MRIDRVKYTAHYDEFGTLKDVWVGAEGSLDDTEVAENQLDKIKEITEKWYQSRHPQPGVQCPPMYFAGEVTGPRVIEVKPEDRAIGLTPELITSCEDITTLQSFYMLVDKSNRVDLKEAYYRRKEELVANGTKEILDATNALTDQMNTSPEFKSKLLDGYNRNTKVKYDNK